MVTIAIIAILAAIAAPSFTPLIERWRVRQAVEALQSTIYLARSEALKRSGGITIVPDTSAWEGWKVKDSSGNTLQVVPPTAKVTISLDKGAGSITVDRWGMLLFGSTTTATTLDFTITPDSGNTANTQHLCVGAGGRVAQKSTC